MTKRPEPVLWLSDARGVYIPRDFAHSFADRAKAVQNVSTEDWDVLERGPDGCVAYWDVWTDVCDNAVVFDGLHNYTLHQDGDLWLIPEGMEWSDEEDTYIWPQKSGHYLEGTHLDVDKT